MGKKSENKTISRDKFIPKLVTQYMSDAQEVINEFPDKKKVAFTDHLLECLDIIEDFYQNNEKKSIWKRYAEIEKVFLEKHGKRLKLYKRKNFHYYYSNQYVLIEMGIISTEQFNALTPEEQGLSITEMQGFILAVRKRLNLEREFSLLEQEPEDEKEQGLLGASNKKGKVKREAQDKLTCLNQEQTVLLMYYLQQERVLLKDEYLSDLDAGKAFEILTGYSQHTLRQNLSKFHLYQNKTNLKEIDNLLTRLKIAIDKALKIK